MCSNTWGLRLFWRQPLPSSGLLVVHGVDITGCHSKGNHYRYCVGSHRACFPRNRAVLLTALCVRTVRCSALCAPLSPMKRSAAGDFSHKELLCGRTGFDAAKEEELHVLNAHELVVLVGEHVEVTDNMVLLAPGLSFSSSLSPWRTPLKRPLSATACVCRWG